MSVVEYTLTSTRPHTHLFEVEVRVAATEGALELVMPSWTPGSYLIREFPRNVQDFAAHDAAGLPLACRKTDKNTWRIDAEGAAAGPVTARYRVYANELSVRTSHLDASHGYVNGASVFMFVRRLEAEAVRLRVEAPPGWRVATTLRETEEHAFEAADYDELADSPLEIGTHETVAWKIGDTLFRYVVWGPHDVDEERLIADTTRIVETCAEMFGGLPFDEYLFILHVVPEARGGLEHRSSTSLLVPPAWLRGGEYESLIALAAHEFFHVWLGKRIRPEPLGPFDYTSENYTRNLWVVEGFTTYYTDLVLRRAGLMTRSRYLERLGDSIARLQALPGRRHQSLEDSSFDAWIKFYRPDAHTPNAQVSYYHKGSLVALALDLEIRRSSGGSRSLDDVLRLLWERYGSRDVGFPEDRERGIQAVVEEVGGAEVGALLERYVAEAVEIDFDGHLEAVGLALVSAGNGPAPEETQGAARDPGRAPPLRIAPPAAHETRLGLRLREEPGGRVRATHVLADLPAYRAGVNAGDEVVGVDGRRATVAEIARILETKSEGDRVELLVMRREQAVTLAIALSPAPERRARITPLPDASAEQARLRDGWLDGGA